MPVGGGGLERLLDFRLALDGFGHARFRPLHLRPRAAVVEHREKLAALDVVARLHADLADRAGQLRRQDGGVGGVDGADGLVKLGRGLQVHGFSLHAADHRPGLCRPLFIGAASGQNVRCDDNEE